MGANQRRRAEVRDAKKKAEREAIAKQYELPKSAVETSKPAHLGRSMFLNKRDYRQYVGAGGTVPQHIDPNRTAPASGAADAQSSAEVASTAKESSADDPERAS